MARPRKPIEHGTPRGYFLHKNRGEDPCPGCRAEWSAYQRRYQKATGRRLARSRALTRLAHEYRARFRELFEEELNRPQGAE